MAGWEEQPEFHRSRTGGRKRLMSRTIGLDCGASGQDSTCHACDCSVRLVQRIIGWAMGLHARTFGHPRFLVMLSCPRHRHRHPRNADARPAALARPETLVALPWLGYCLRLASSLQHYQRPKTGKTLTQFDSDEETTFLCWSFGQMLPAAAQRGHRKNCSQKPTHVRSSIVAFAMEWETSLRSNLIMNQSTYKIASRGASDRETESVGLIHR